MIKECGALHLDTPVLPQEVHVALRRFRFHTCPTCQGFKACAAFRMRGREEQGCLKDVAHGRQRALVKDEDPYAQVLHIPDLRLCQPEAHDRSLDRGQRRFISNVKLFRPPMGAGKEPNRKCDPVKKPKTSLQVLIQQTSP